MLSIEQGHITTELTVVIRAREGESIAELAPFLKAGSTVAVGRSGAVVTNVSTGDQIAEAGLLANQVIIAESAMRRGALMHDQDHLPALRRVIDHVPALYPQVADQIKQAALDDGDDEAAADEAAGQAIRVLVMFKQRLEKLLEPDLLTPSPHADLITEKPVVAETPYAQVRVTDIGEWIRTVTNAKRYEWLRDVAFETPRHGLVVREWGGSMLINAELDAEIDQAMREYPGVAQQEVAQ